MKNKPEKTQNTFIKTFIKSRFAIVCDDADMGNRGILVAPAQNITAPKVNHLIHLSGGVVFVAVSAARAESFMLAPMARPRMVPGEHLQPGRIGPFLDCLESVEAREGVTTGISTHDRATTISILGQKNPSPRKLVKPGHIFPVLVRPGGVLVRNALPEAAHDIVKIAGFTDAAAFADILDKDGEFLTGEKLVELGKSEKIPFITLGDLVKLRLQTESLVYKVAEAKLPTRLAGDLKSCIYKSTVHEGEHMALIKGELNGEDPVLLRVQPEFTFGDVFGGSNPPTRSQLQRSLKAIGERGRGVLLYLRRPATGQLKEQVSSWEKEFKERPGTLLREYGLGAQILRDLGVRKVELLTGTKVDMLGLGTFGIEVVAQRPVPS